MITQREEQLQKQAELSFNCESDRQIFMAGARWADQTAPQFKKDMELNLLRKQLTDIAARLDDLYGIRLQHATLDYAGGTIVGVRFTYAEWDICDYKRVKED